MYNITKFPKRYEGEAPVKVSYIPHGVDEEVFRPLDRDDPQVEAMRERVFGDAEVVYSFLFTGRNIERKNITSLILAFADLIQADHVSDDTYLVLHTDPKDENGVDLIQFTHAMTNQHVVERVIFFNERLTREELNVLYNTVDCHVLPSHSEGFGLPNLEMMMTDGQVIATSTGGLKDQLEGLWPSDAGQLVPPSAEIIRGSINTPYIKEDHLYYEDLANAMEIAYEKRQSKKDTRDFAISRGFTASEMGEQMGDFIESVIDDFEPKRRVILYKAGEQ